MLRLALARLLYARLGQAMAKSAGRPPSAPTGRRRLHNDFIAANWVALLV